jgi:hypothetical protein
MERNTSSELCGSCHSGEYGKNRFEDFTDGTPTLGSLVLAIIYQRKIILSNFKRVLVPLVTQGKKYTQAVL